ncbi:MAG TPA: hypothetical protein VM327_09695 [Candidatus Thermoplasmatota archaeon]|nr:hypothetical protein [Candidatus Thermoplasmatota archaeon]
MRPLEAVLAALVVLATLPLATGQAAAAAVDVLEDLAGDTAVMAGNTPADNPAGRYQATDLRGLQVEESVSDFTFHLAVADLKGDGTQTVVESSQYGIRFEHHGAQYQVHLYRTVITSSSYFAVLEAFDPARGEYSSPLGLPVAADEAAGTMVVAVPRDLLLDSDGAAPFPGRSLAGFHVASWSGFGDFGSISLGPGGGVPIPSVQVVDAMPDSGNGTRDWAVRFGLQQTGDAHLSAQVPTRASNGEATTFVFVVDARNDGATQRFRLSTTGVPAGWKVDLPSDLVEVDGGASLRLPVLVSTPFAHQHGTLQDFVLEMAGTDDPGDVGRVQLGVRYTAPPQPAGHHDTLYIHTAKPQGDQTFQTVFGSAFGFDLQSLYFNTMTPDEDENDGGNPVGGQESGFGFSSPPPTVTYQWNVALSPALQLGLDFDPSRVGSVKLAIDSLLPLTGAVLEGRLVHTMPDGRSFDDCEDGCEATAEDFRFGFGNHTTAATIGPTTPRDVAPNSQVVLFEAPIAVTPQGDFFPFSPGAALSLQLNLTFVRVDPFFGPKDVPKLHGGEVVLPLLEYHDPVDQVFSSLSGLMIEVRGEQQRLVNPGETALFELTLMNHGNGTASYDLSLSGTNLAWAVILGDTTVQVEAGTSRPLGIAVTVPPGTPDGEVADLVLTAADAKDPSVRTLVRLVATVDTEVDQQDDTARVPGLADSLTGKDSPAPAATLALLALAVGALAMRRRRG